MAANVSPHERDAPPPVRGSLLLVVGLFTSLVLAAFAGDFRSDLWWPLVGVALAFTFWLGGRFAALFIFVLAALVLAAWLTWGNQTRTYPFALPALILCVEAVEVVAAWWLYIRIAKGSREIDDPQSAVLFLVLIPGGVAAAAAGANAYVVHALHDEASSFVRLFGEFWIRDLLSFLVITPFLVVNVTPFLRRAGLVPQSTSKPLADVLWTWGESIELTGLALGNLMLSFIQVYLHVELGNSAWPLWGISLLLVVWSSIRQGLRGGTVTAFAGSAVALLWASANDVTPAAFSPLQGNLLAQCSIALLVGSSVGWIRATEARYRHVVGHIPLILTSVRLNRGATLHPHGVPLKTTSGSKPELKTGAQVLGEAEIVLVSRASTQIVGVDPDRLLGPFSLWLDLVHPNDREIVIASISQLGLERQTITCEYRIVGPNQPTPSPNGAPAETPPKPARWVRDTLAPHYTGDGLLDGWDGVVEEITEQRTLQQENLRVAGMLQALIANMPMGVFFVQGPVGQPILVNARARQLLGQREDMAAGLAHMSQTYRLHRQDGAEYPVDDLPIAKALRYGQTCTANDIVVHRPDGRRVPLFTWAAPIDLGKVGRPEAAVWVLEDLSALQQSEFARRESEARLRAVFETLAEGVIVQNRAGIIIEGNPSAAAILGTTIEKLVGRSWLGPEHGCLRDDGTRCPADEQPDRLALQIKMPVRNVVVGLPRETGEVRWALVNSMPLPVGTAFAPNSKGAQLVTTFADITAERLAQRVILAAKDKYQTLVESLPVMVLQLDPSGAVAFMNPAAQDFLAATAGDFAVPGVFEALFEPADQPRVSLALQDAGHGADSRFEFGLRNKAEDAKIGLALIHPLWQETKVVGSIWIVVDMTRQRRLEEELVKSQRLELVNRLASGNVHDFNNLMMGVIATASALKSQTADRPDLQDDLDIIERTADEASKLLAQILSLGKNAARPAQSIDINSVIRDTLGLLKNVIPGNIRVQTQFAEETLTIAADDLQIKQVVLNLCLNARDAMPAGGTLRVSTRSDRKDKIDWAIIAVKDTGHGIPDDIREKIYEPFFTTKEHGTGIGLSVVRDIVQRLDGSIDVWSELGKGTNFEVGLRMIG